MPNPITLAQVRRDSTIPEDLGLCVDDIPRIAKVVNTAQERLILAGGETGWWGGWQRVRFPISAAAPYITLPRQFARIINLAVCHRGIPLNNEFFELLPHGNGLAPGRNRPDWCGDIEGYERGTTPLMVDLTPTNQFLRAYVTDNRDIGKRMLISGLDQNGNQIYDASPSLGFYLTFASPFVTSGFIVTDVQTVQKDFTFGDVILQQVDATTGNFVNLARYGPNEINPRYRRYLISRIPSLCCGPGNIPPNISVTSLCKLEYIPVVQDTDWLIIQSIPALEEECQSLRFSKMEASAGATLAVKHHRDAIKLLRDQLRHYEGEQTPAVNVDIWGGAPLEDQSIGTLI